jgi:hypothetical protein
MRVVIVTCILKASMSDSSSSSLEVHPMMVSSSSKEGEFMGWHWVDGAVPEKSLFNVSVSKKAEYDIVPTRENIGSLRMFVAGDSTTC